MHFIFVKLRKSAQAILVLLLFSSATSCIEKEQAFETAPRWAESGVDSENFWRRPYPLGAQPQGRIRLFPEADGNRIVKKMKGLVDSYPAFSRTAPIWVPFDGVPVPALAHRTTKWAASGVVTAQTLADPLLLVQITDSGLIQVPRLHWRIVTLASRFAPAGLLTVLPQPGLNLAADSEYLLVVRDSFFADKMNQSERFAEILNNKDPHFMLEDEERYLRDKLNQAKAAELSLDDMVIATAFKTGAPTAPIHELANYYRDLMPTQIDRVHKTRTSPDFCLFEGSLSMPQRQNGSPPYSAGGGDRVGIEEPHTRYDEVPYSFAVPVSATGIGDLPLFFFIHGTAGLSTQLADRGYIGSNDVHAPDNSGPAKWLAQQKIATAGAALPINPQRVPNALGWGFYDFTNPVAIRDNFIQGALESMWFVNWLFSLQDTNLSCGSFINSKGTLFRKQGFTAFGQSLGSIELGIYGAIDPRPEGLVPSGAGGHLSTMVAHSRTLPGELLLGLLIGADPDEPLDELHPLLGLVQMMIDPADPALYAEQWAVAPPAGGTAKHVYMPAGWDDGFFAPESQGAVALAARLSWVNQGVEPRLPWIMETNGTARLQLPADPNLTTAQGKRLATLASWAEDEVLDGHHVSYQRQEARTQYVCFVQSIVKGHPQVVDPATGCY